MESILHKYLDGCVSPAELEELSRGLAENGPLCDAFVRMTRLEAQLSTHLADHREASRSQGAMVRLAIEQFDAPTAQREPKYPANVLRRPEAQPGIARVADAGLATRHTRAGSWAMLAAGLLLACGVAWLLGTGSPGARHAVLAGRVLVDGVTATSIPDGSRMEVAEGDTAVVRLLSGSQASFAPATAAVFRANQELDQVLELDQGGGRFQLTRHGPPLRVDTPVGVVKAGGGDAQPTDFSVKLVPVSTEGAQPMSRPMLFLLSVMVVTGQVEVRSEEQDVTLKAGDSRTFTPSKKPMLSGQVAAVSDDGRLITLETPTKPGGEPRRFDVRVNERTEVIYHGMPQGGDKPTVGYPVVAWLDKEAPEQALRIEFGVNKPDIDGRIEAVSDDGKQITIEVMRKGSPATQHVAKIGEVTSLNFDDVREGEHRPTVGFRAQVWLTKDQPDAAATIRFGSKGKGKIVEQNSDGKSAGKKAPAESSDKAAPEAKTKKPSPVDPANAPPDKKTKLTTVEQPDKNVKSEKSGKADNLPELDGRIVAVSDDAKQITLEVTHKGNPATQHVAKIGDRTTLNYDEVQEGEHRPTVGFRAQVWLFLNGEAEEAAAVRFSYKTNPGKAAAQNPDGKSALKKTPAEPSEKALPGTKAKEPSPADPAHASPDKNENTDKTGKPIKQPAEQVPEKTPAKSAGGKVLPAALARRSTTRDPGPISAAIDEEISAALHAAAIPASPLADDDEFARRAALDITGHIASYDRTVAFLDNRATDKRSMLVAELLNSPDYGRHLGATWRRLIVPREPANGKARVDRFGPWLADEFNSNRGWDRIVYDLLTAEGDITRDPQAGFMFGNTDNLEPRANLLANSAGQLFLGVQLGCAECHNHPFAEWKQTDFWSLAAFFSRVHRRGKSDFSLTEAIENPADDLRIGDGPAIRLPESAGKAAGDVVAARFLGSPAVSLPAGEPLRPTLARWMTAPENRLFARAAVNRLWAHFLGRGLVHPVAAMHADNLPSHPRVLQLLADEFVASDFDLQHLVRCICNTQAYQRTSRPLPRNKDDAILLSHLAIKVLTADQLYDSLLVVLNANPARPAQPPGAKQTKFSPVQLEPREQFVAFFTPIESADAGQFSQGIPQLMRLMNTQPYNQGAPFLTELAGARAPRQQAIETIYLTILSRRPTDEELQLVSAYSAGNDDAAEVYAGLFWSLLNSGEFMLNH